MDFLQHAIFAGINRVLIGIFRMFPIKTNYIVLESEVDFTDNTRTFYEYLLSTGRNQTYKIIWFVHEPSKYAAVHNVEFVSRFGNSIHWRADYYIGVSKFFVYTHEGWLRRWRKKQVAIHTTHSAYQIKKLAVGKKPMADYVLTCGDAAADSRYKSSCLPRERMLTIGMPRVDLLYAHKECIPLLIPGYKNEKIILAMPTMKKAINWDDGSGEVDYVLNIAKSADDLMALNGILEEKNYYMIVKIHHLQDISALRLVRCNRIIYLKDSDLSRYDIQVNELLENADVLLTDYSSVFFEYLLLNRPIGFLIGDMSTYKRGFEEMNPLDDMPGYKLENIEAFERFLNDIACGLDQYEEAREMLKKKIFNHDDNKNSERLYRWIDANR